MAPLDLTEAQHIHLTDTETQQQIVAGPARHTARRFRAVEISAGFASWNAKPSARTVS